MATITETARQFVDACETGKTTHADYVYVIVFEGGVSRHMTKIWNAGWTMKELGWA
jgi:hypothetical protein